VANTVACPSRRAGLCVSEVGWVCCPLRYLSRVYFHSSCLTPPRTRGRADDGFSTLQRLLSQEWPVIVVKDRKLEAGESNMCWTCMMSCSLCWFRTRICDASFGFSTVLSICTKDRRKIRRSGSGALRFAG